MWLLEGRVSLLVKAHLITYKLAPLVWIILLRRRYLDSGEGGVSYTYTCQILPAPVGSRCERFWI